MKVVLTGGGSGGHITPLLAVAHELKIIDPHLSIIYIGLRGDSLSDIPESNPDFDEVYTVRAGKFRRYYGEGLKQILDMKTVVKNLRDAGRVIIGLRQSLRLLKKIKPDVIFIKGSLVGVPVGLAAAKLHIPYVTHDSDAVPGLANKIIARWASMHTVALPSEIYPYPKQKTITVGVPVSQDYTYVTPQSQDKFRNELGLEHNQIIFISGGGLGAHRLNQAISSVVPKLLLTYPKLVIIQASGRQHETQLKNQYQASLTNDDISRVIVKGFIEDHFRYSGAADLVIARAGATTVAELAAQGKACLIVPNPYLTGGHQLKNAKQLSQAGAVEIVQEHDLNNAAKLFLIIKNLLDDNNKRNELGKRLHKFSNPKAAQELAKILLEVVKNKNTDYVVQKT